MLKVSVIIPVYNAKDYLHRCLDSVCNQTLKDIEIICVDDCSTDNSFEILQEYAIKYSNLTAIHCEKNGGESVARNIGLNHATGNYIAFVDNDDEVDLDFYEKLYTKAVKEDSDIAKGEIKQIDYNGKVSFEGLNNKIRENGNNPLVFAWHWWTGIFKSSIIKENNIHFLEGYPLGGDILFLNEITTRSKNIVLVDDALYHYFRRENSGDSKFLPIEKIKSATTIFDLIYKNLDAQPFDKIAVAFIKYSFLASTLRYAFRCKTIENLKYCIDRSFYLYQKSLDNSFMYLELKKNLPIEASFFKNNDKESLFNFYKINDTTQKMIIANLRYKAQNKR